MTRRFDKKNQSVSFGFGLSKSKSARIRKVLVTPGSPVREGYATPDSSKSGSVEPKISIDVTSGVSAAQLPTKTDLLLQAALKKALPGASPVEGGSSPVSASPRSEALSSRPLSEPSSSSSGSKSLRLDIERDAIIGENASLLDSQVYYQTLRARQKGSQSSPASPRTFGQKALNALALLLMMGASVSPGPSAILKGAGNTLKQINEVAKQARELGPRSFVCSN